MMVAQYLGALICLGIIGILLYSLLGSRGIWDLDVGEGLLSLLKARRDRLLRSIKELRLEHEVGVLTSEEFERRELELSPEAPAE